MAETRKTTSPYGGERIFIEDGFLTPIPLIFEEEDTRNLASSNRFRIGQLYALTSEECEDVAMRPKIYECKGQFTIFNGLELNSVVMKLVEGEQQTIYSLTRIDCKLLGIQYEPQLQLFPMDLPWEQLDGNLQSRPFDPNNLGTYTTNPKDGTVRRMHVFINHVTPHTRGYVMTPNGLAVNHNQFFGTLRAVFKDAAFARKYQLMLKPLCIKDSKEQIFDHEKAGINVMLFFTTSAEQQGIPLEELEGKRIDDLVKIFWMSTNQHHLKEEDKEEKSWLMTENQFYQSMKKLQESMVDDIVRNYYKSMPYHNPFGGPGI